MKQGKAVSRHTYTRPIYLIAGLFMLAGGLLGPALLVRALFHGEKVFEALLVSCFGAVLGYGAWIHLSDFLMTRIELTDAALRYRDRMGRVILLPFTSIDSYEQLSGASAKHVATYRVVGQGHEIHFNTLITRFDLLDRAMLEVVARKPR